MANMLANKKTILYIQDRYGYSLVINMNFLLRKV